MLIINTQPRLYNIANLCDLKPGANEVDAAVWSEAKKIRVVQILVDTGVLVEQSITTLKDAKPEDAIKLVKETLDTALLGKWLDAETRRRVKDAINEQLAMLAGAAKAAADEAAKVKDS